MTRRAAPGRGREWLDWHQLDLRRHELAGAALGKVRVLSLTVCGLTEAFDIVIQSSRIFPRAQL